MLLRSPWFRAATYTAAFIAGSLILPLLTGDWPDEPAAPYTYGAIAAFSAYYFGWRAGERS